MDGLSQAIIDELAERDVTHIAALLAQGMIWEAIAFGVVCGKVLGVDAANAAFTQ